MSEVRYHIDWETFSKCPIKLGAYRYAEDPSTEILLGCVARGNNRPRVWDYSNQGSLESLEAAVMFKEIVENPEAVVYAHNSQFEWAISKHLWQKTFWLRPPKIEQFRCTMAMARRSALPSSLGELGKFLKLPFQKDKAGEWLIKIFCSPRTQGKLKGTRITPDMDMQVTLLGEKMSVKEAWKRFKGYNLFDVLTEREVEKVLKPFDLEGETLEAFLFDARMNDRGIPVNREALVIANQKINDYQSRRAADFKCLTGLEPSQTAKVLAWLRERGYEGENLQAATMEDYIETPGKMTTEALEALKTRSEVSYAAVKKIPTMLASAGRDGMVRGGLLWSGAERTHRWSGRIIQPQNFKRPTIKDTADAYAALCRGMTVKGMEMIWGPFLETSASCIRHFIQHPEHHFLDSDFANIEARITPWVSGQDDLVEDFRTLDRLKREGASEDLIKLADPYVKMAAVIFDTPAPDIVDDERFVGKQSILLCGFQGGWVKFQETCKKYGRELEDDLCELTVSAYRKKNDKIVSMWNAMQQAAISAIENPGHNFVVRGRATFGMAKGLPYRALVMKLPSGHFLVYPEPAIRPIWMFKKQRYATRQDAQRDFDILKKMGKLEEKDRVWETKEISFYGPDENGHWCRQTTYGGKLLENCLSGETEVLTESGWMRIDKITTERVFDGFEFVNHSGLKVTEKTCTIGVDGLWMTPDHLVQTASGWHTASTVNIQDAYGHFQTCFRTTVLENQRLDRRGLWKSHCHSATTSGRNRKSGLVLQMSLWRHPVSDHIRSYQRGEMLWAQVLADRQRNSRYVHTSSLLGMEKHERPLPIAHPSGMAQLWWPGHQSLCPMGVVSQFLERHGLNLSNGSHSGTPEQRKGVFPTKLLLGNLESSGVKSALQCNPGHSQGKNDHGSGSRGIQNWENNTLLPDCSRGQRERPVQKTRREEPVYDLLNCGSRHQFVVRGENKKPIIVHNCVQAIAGDFITHGILIAEKKGYNIFLLIHDQTLALNDRPGTHSPEHFKNCLCTVPKWAAGFPLDASVAITPYYQKG